MKTILNSRRDRYLAKFSILLITLALIAGMVGCTDPDPESLEIYDWKDLDAVRKYKYLGGHHTLMNDLNAETAGYEGLASPAAHGGKGWEPIDNFHGSFDGQDDKGQEHTIKGLFIDRTSESDVGLFGSIAEGGVIKNVKVVDVTVKGRDDVGGLVGENSGTVSKSFSSGSVTGDDYVGGLVGRNKGDVSDDSHSTGSVTGEDSIGGLVGWNKGDVSDSYSTSTGSVTGKNGVGGLVGWNYEGNVSNSYFTGNVTSKEGSYIGGLVGKNDGGNVSNSYSTGSVSGENGVGVGGLVGWNYYLATVSNSYSTGSVSGENGVGVGGLVGNNYKGWVRNSHYNYDEVLINDQKIITIGALFDKDFKDFEECLANGKVLDVNKRLSKEDGYYVVNNVSDFKQLLAFGQDDSLKFRLKTDLDLATEPNFYIPYFAGKFDGKFDGKRHKISNLSFKFDFVCNVGLFGYLARGGRVTQVGVENVNITGASSVGGLVGYNWEGTVGDSYSTGRVISYESYGSGLEDSLVTGVGGLVGINSKTVSNSYSTCRVISYGSYDSGIEDLLVTGVGGLVGCNYKEGTVENCNSTGSVFSYGSYGSGLEDLLVTGVGGLVGINSETVRNSHSTGSVTGDNYVGGLVGRNEDHVSESFSTGTVSGRNDVGGLVGRNEDDVIESFSTGIVSGRDYVGGLVGRNAGTVSNSYSTGNVRGDNWIGGLVGYNEDDCTVNTTYSTGRVTSVTRDDDVGGLVGWNEGDEGDVSNSFWDQVTSGMEESDGGTGKSTIEMQDDATFTEWDIWAFADGVPDTEFTWYIFKGEYPILSWQSVS